jgi:hypothetical protein
MRRFTFLLPLFLIILGITAAARAAEFDKPDGPEAQATSNSGAVSGTVTDDTGAVIPGATVVISNPVSGYTRTTTSDAEGNYRFANLPFNNYHVVASANGFNSQEADAQVRNAIPVTLGWKLTISSVSQTVNVSADSGDLLENTPTGHTDIDRDLFTKIPLESNSSSVSSLVTLASPGVAADSNGLFHGMGDHASNSFSVDGQPITDQQSKVFSNQIPLDSVESLEVIPGAPPAEFGGKTSLVIVATTRSGQNVTVPHGDLIASYGSFGSANVGANLAYGTAKWGNFISISGLNSGRFLDPPEFTVMHAKGNEESLFDRVDYALTDANSLHVNFGYTRSWFQTPNSYDSEYATQWAGTGIDPGPADQRSQIQTVNFAPTFTRLIDSKTVFNLGSYFRRDGYNYYGSANPLADRGPVNLQQESIDQQRSLFNYGVRSDITHTQGVHTIKAGVTYQQTVLNENDDLGIVDPNLIPNITPSCLVNGQPIPGTPCATLFPYDLTRGGTFYDFIGHTDVKELALYAQDAISVGHWSMNLGLRQDFYNGLTTAKQTEPRLGVSYKIDRSNTILRVSYARTLESPFNENLVLASEGCNSDVIAAIITCVNAPTRPGFRNDFHAGFQQALTKYAVFSGDYVWKYTHNAFDFSVLGATPITFPIGWHNSKIPGYDGRLSVPAIHGFSALVVFSSVAARFFTPQTSGLGTVPTPPGNSAFRIDHDEKFNQTTHLQYQPKARLPWAGFNWRYDSGLVAGAAPCYSTEVFSNCPQSTLIGNTPAVKMEDPFGNPLTADQEFQAGFACNGQRATPTNALPFVCPAAEFTSKLISIPKPNTENDDKNPPRIAPRSLFDIALGDDNLFHGERYKFSARISVTNLTNKYALYNFLSTFSGTHYVSPRATTAEIGFHF